MSDDDEKFRMASLIRVSNEFTVADIVNSLEVDQASDTLHIVISELIEKNLLELFERPQLTFDEETLAFGVAMVKVYQLVQERRDEFDQYLEDLNRQRFLPDPDSKKPRGLSYRILEQLVEDIIEHPDTLLEKDALIQLYLASAEAEELSGRQDALQQAVSEAYLRELYGKYLEVKRNWGGAG